MDLQARKDAKLSTKGVTWHPVGNVWSVAKQIRTYIKRSQELPRYSALLKLYSQLQVP